MDKVVGGWAEGEGEADSPLSRELMRGLIPGPWDHDLSQRQMLNHLSHPGAPNKILKKKKGKERNPSISTMCTMAKLCARYK